MSSIDGNGNKYYFGGKDRQDAIEYSVGFFNQHNSEIAATAWHLTRIEYADGRTAEFSYQKKDYIAEMGISDTYSLFFVHASSPYFKIDHGNRYEMYNGQSGNHDYRECDFIDGSLIIPSYLTNIKFGEYEIDFSTTPSQELEYPMERIYQMHFRPSFINQNEQLVYLQHFDVNGRSVGSKPGQYGWIQNLRWHKLSDISLKINGTELRHFNFDYNDTIAESGNRQRLYLLGIAESGKGSYHFEYDRIGALPQYCTYNVDHWGFYKENVSALPYSEVHKRIYGSDTELIKEDTYEYKYPNLTSPVAINRQLTASGPVQRTEITYGPYDKPLMVKDVLSGERMIYVWSYDYGHIVATIKNADLSRVEDVIGNLGTIGRSKNPDYAVLKSLQTRFPNEVYIYKYLPGIGMSECINPDGTIIKYHYDAYGRLSYTTDDEDNVIEMYDYHYADE